MYAERYGERAGEWVGERVIYPFPAVSFQPQIERDGERVIDDRPVCPMCFHPFTKKRGNQVFCSRRHSQDACEIRKAKAVDLIHQLYGHYGLSHDRVQDIAEVCWTRLRAHVESLGFIYDEYLKKWVFSIESIVNALYA